LIANKKKSTTKLERDGQFATRTSGSFIHYDPIKRTLLQPNLRLPQPHTSPSDDLPGLREELVKVPMASPERIFPVIC